jgi:Spy/CpxP family protein refolding chaperone
MEGSNGKGIAIEPKTPGFRWINPSCTPNTFLPLPSSPQNMLPLLFDIVSYTPNYPYLLLLHSKEDGMRSSKENQMIKNNPRIWVSRLMVASLFGCAVILGTGVVWADGDDHGYKHDPQSQLEKMTKKLDLTKEQQDKILPILQDKHQKMEALHNQMKEMRQNAMSQIEAQLTPEQQEKKNEGIPRETREGSQKRQI